ncbi:hypothetical protein [Candidatus Merdisoma sp. JLR.KK006]|uniref:hypothetical protein n=1 Tax=Candidatus Merdisoma sp. JLR.KK006 TaxID=3112626 RepID=UPI002FEF506C
MTDSEKLDLILSELQGVKNNVQGLEGEQQGMKSDMQSMKSDMQGMKSDMQSMKSDMQGMKSDMQSMKSELQDMKSDMQGMKSELQDMKNNMQKLERKVTGIEVHLENVTDRNIRLIAEGHLDLSRKLDEALKVENEKELQGIRLNILEDEIRKIKEQFAATA